MYNAFRLLHPAFSTCQIIFSPSLPCTRTRPYVRTHIYACENVFKHKT